MKLIKSVIRGWLYSMIKWGMLKKLRAKTPTGYKRLHVHVTWTIFPNGNFVIWTITVSYQISLCLGSCSFAAHKTLEDQNLKKEKFLQNVCNITLIIKKQDNIPRSSPLKEVDALEDITTAELLWEVDVILYKHFQPIWKLYSIRNSRGWQKQSCRLRVLTTLRGRKTQDEPLPYHFLPVNSNELR